MIDDSIKFNPIHLSLPIKLLIFYIALIFFAPQERYTLVANFRPMFSIAILIFIVSLIYKSNETVKSVKNPVELYLLFLLGLFFLLSNLFSPLPNFQIPPRFYLYIKLLILVVLLVKVVNTENEIYNVILSMIIFCGIICLYSILSYKFGWTEVYYRMRSPFGGMGSNSNGFAMLLVGLLPFFIVLFLHEEKILIKIIYAVVILCILMCIIKTRSRMGFLGMIIVFMGVSIYNIKRVGVVIITVLLISLALFRAGENFWTRINTITIKTENISIHSSDRRNKWRQALILMKEYPVLGVGQSRFREAVRLHNLGEDEHVVHNAYLEIGSETGIVAVSIFISILLMTLCRNIKAIKIYQKLKNPIMKEIAFSLTLSMISFLFSVVFLSEQYNTLLYIIIGLSLSLYKISYIRSNSMQKKG